MLRVWHLSGPLLQPGRRSRNPWKSQAPDDGDRARNSAKEAGRSQTPRGTLVSKCSSSQTIFWVWQIWKSPRRKNGFVSLDLMPPNSTFSYGKVTSATSREKQKEVCCLSPAAIFYYDFHLSGLLLLGGLPHLGENECIIFISKYWMQIKQKMTLICDVKTNWRFMSDTYSLTIFSVNPQNNLKRLLTRFYFWMNPAVMSA